MSHAASASRALHPWAVYLAVATATGAFLGALGPYGSYLNGPAFERIVYWVLTAWLGVAVVGGAAVAASRVAARLGWPIWPTIVGAVLLACLPLSQLIAAIARRTWPGIPAIATMDPWSWYAQTAAVTVFQLAAFALTAAALRRRRTPAAPVEPATALPAAAVSDVLCLQMEDHYVRIHTAEGSRLAHGTMSQAIAAQAGREGLQVHRSWWVARDAVRGHAWEGRNLRLELVNGVQAPVSRSAVARLRAAGWLPPE